MEAGGEGGGESEDPGGIIWFSGKRMGDQSSQGIKGGNLRKLTSNKGGSLVVLQSLKGGSGKFLLQSSKVGSGKFFTTKPYRGSRQIFTTKP